MTEEMEFAIARVDGAIDNFWWSPVTDIIEPWVLVIKSFAELDKILPESLFEVGERGYTFETMPWPKAEPDSLEYHMRTLFACLRQARTFFDSYGAFTTNMTNLRAALSGVCLLCPNYHGEIGWMFGES